MKLSKWMLGGAVAAAALACAFAYGGTQKADNTAAAVSAPLYSPMPGAHPQGLLRVATLPECVDDYGVCVQGGTKCCSDTFECKGKFPNTTCQPK